MKSNKDDEKQMNERVESPGFIYGQEQVHDERANNNKTKIRVQAGSRRQPARPTPPAKSSGADVKASLSNQKNKMKRRPPASAGEAKQGRAGEFPQDTPPPNDVSDFAAGSFDPSSTPNKNALVSDSLGNIPENVDPLSKTLGNNGRKLSEKGGYKYNKETFPQLAEELVGKLGARNKDLAEYFEVSTKAIEYWIRTKTDFAEAVRRGRVRTTLRVAQSLYNKAVGYELEETVVMQNIVKEYYENGKPKRVYNDPIKVVIKKQMPPDTFAATTFLKAMHKEVWSETHQVNVNHEHNINITKVEELDMSKLSEQVREFLFDIHLNQLSQPQNN